MSAVVSAISNAVSDVVDAVGSVGQSIIDTGSKALAAVDDAAHTVVNSAIKDPIGTIAKVAAVATGQYELLPVISAADTIAHGGDLGDAAKSAAISYAAQGVGNYVGGQLGTSLEYGTDLGSAQTAQLAAQSGDMLGGTTSGTIGGAAGAAAAGATAGVLSGGNVDQAVINALGNYAARTGIGYTFNAAGQLVDQAGNPAPADAQSEIASTADAMRTDNPTIVDNLDGTYTQTFDDGTTQTFTKDYAPVSATTTDGGTVYPGAELQPSTAVEQPANTDLLANPTIVKNPDGTYTQTFDDGTTQTFDENMQPISATTTEGDVIYPGAELQPSSGEGTDIAPESELNTKAIQDYFKNKFGSALASELMSQTTGGKLSYDKYGKPTYKPRGQYNFGSPSAVDLALNQLGLSSGEDTSGDTTPNVFYPDLIGSAELFNPTKGMTWAPVSKIGGLGFAGKYINREPDTYYVNKDVDQREKAKQDAFLSEGWQLDPTLQEDPYYNYQIDTTEEPIQQAAEGGLIDHRPEFYSEGGASLANRYVKGDGDGTSDSVPAMLASGEFVIPADVVSSLGNGDNDAGASVLDQFMASVRKHKRAAAPDQLPPDSKGPLAYLKEAQKKGKKHGRTK